MEETEKVEYSIGIVGEDGQTMPIMGGGPYTLPKGRIADIAEAMKLKMLELQREAGIEEWS